MRSSQNQEAPSTHPILSRRLLVFLVGMALVEASRTLTMVQVPVYLRELGAQIPDIGLFFTITMVFPLVLRILGGWFSDSLGRLRALTFGSLAGAVAYVAYVLSPTWQFALIGPALLATASAFTFPSYKAYIADTTPVATRARAFGISEAVVTSTWIFGPPLGGFLAQNYGSRLLFTCAALTFVAAALLFALLGTRAGPSPDLVRSKPSLKSLRLSLQEMLALMFSGGLVTWLLITDGIYDITSRMSFDLMPVYLSDIALMSKQSIGLLDGIFGVAIAGISIPAGWLVDKTSERLGVVFGLICLIVSRLIFALTNTFWGFALSWALLGIGAGMLEPAYGALIAKGVPRRLRGLTYGLLTTSLGLVSLPSPWIGGQIWTHIGPKAPFFATVILGTAAIIPAWLKLVPTSKEDPDGETTTEPGR